VLASQFCTGSSCLQKIETKASSQIQGLQAELLRLQREMDAYKTDAQKKDAALESLASSRGAAESEAGATKRRAAAAASSAEAAQAEVRRLQGYVTQLEAAQRSKDAQARSPSLVRGSSCLPLSACYSQAPQPCHTTARPCDQ
jgi:chromosome segregation ATPase